MKKHRDLSLLLKSESDPMNEIRRKVIEINGANQWMAYDTSAETFASNYAKSQLLRVWALMWLLEALRRTRRGTSDE